VRLKGESAEREIKDGCGVSGIRLRFLEGRHVEKEGNQLSQKEGGMEEVGGDKGFF